MAIPRLCSIPNCGKPVYGHGWCCGHNRRWRLYGSPLGGRTTPGELLRYYTETVLPHADKTNCLAWPFGRSTKGYGKIWIDGRSFIVSRLACEAINGPPPTPEHEAAHNCGKGHEGCVNPLHVRWATRTENFADKLIHGTSNRGARHWTNNRSELRS